MQWNKKYLFRKDLRKRQKQRQRQRQRQNFHEISQNFNENFMEFSWNLREIFENSSRNLREFFTKSSRSFTKGEQELQWDVRKNGISQQPMNENGIRFLRQKRFWNRRACEAGKQQYVMFFPQSYFWPIGIEFTF